MNRFVPLIVLALVLAGGCADEAAPADEGPTLEVVDGEIVIPQSAITELAGGYSFSADLEIDSPENDLISRLRAIDLDLDSQAPDALVMVYLDLSGSQRSSLLSRRPQPTRIQPADAEDRCLAALVRDR